MFRACLIILTASLLQAAPDLPMKPVLNLASIKLMVAAAEAEAQKRGVNVTICIADDNANILFLQKADKASLTSIQYAQGKARHSASFGQPSKAAADRLKSGDFTVLAMPGAFPNQGGLPIKIDGKTIGAIGVSGATSDVDEAIGQVAIDALLK
jgi:glc operon protein GlcG